MTFSDQKTPQLSRLETIRTRLIVAFSAVALLPFLGLVFITLVSGAQGGQQEAFNQLTNVLSYKADAIKSWTDALRVELGGIMLGENLAPTIEEYSSTSSNQPSQELYEIIRSSLEERARQSRYFEELFILDLSGVVIASTKDALEGLSYRDENFFSVGTQTSYIQSPFFSPEFHSTTIFVARPIRNQNLDVVGVLAGKANNLPLNEIIRDKTGLGETGNAYLLGSDHTLFGGLDPKLRGTKIYTEAAEAALSNEDTSSKAYLNYRNVPVFSAYQWIIDLEVMLMAEQERIESTRVAYAGLAINLSVAFASILIALFLALLVTRTIAAPVADLADTATQIAAGERQLSASVERADELGILAQAFNSMTRQLNSLISDLEQRVAQRTQELELRSNYLEATVEVSRVASAILDPEQLVEETVDLIRESFGLYYVGLFLVVNQREWAVLRAGTGQAGEKMLARGHRLPIGNASMIGWCIANAQARVAQEATTDIVRLATPELPDTRSEAALPIRSRGQVIGAISVQSEQPNAFDESTLAVLQSMADQLAVAFDNARLYAESQVALGAERRAYAKQSQLSWEAWLASQTSFSLQGDGRTASRTEHIWNAEMNQAFQERKTLQAEHKLAIPIQVRGAVIGVFYVGRNPAATHNRSEWTSDDITFLESVAEQLGVALDSARLYTETQQRAEHERLVGDVTSRLRETFDIQTILKTAVSEIRDALELAEVEVRIGAGKENIRYSDGNHTE